MNEEVIKYLKTEREISSFKIESLKKISSYSSPVTKRLIEIEEEFLSIKFEELANTMPELLAAIKIFRDSRAAFSEFYPPQPKKDTWVEEDSYIRFIIKKIKDEINKASSKSEDFNIKEERAAGRLIAILLCLILYLEKIDLDLDRMKIYGFKKEIGKEILGKYSQDIFIFYNDVISLKHKFSFLSKQQIELLKVVKPLVHVDMEKSNDFFIIRPLKIKGQKTFGFFIPHRHIGREILRPYYIKIYDKNNVNVSKLFSLQPKSIIPDFSNDYYKFIQIINPEIISDNLILLDKYNYLIKEVFNQKLNKEKGLSLNLSSSFILIPQSRTEDEGLKDSSVIVHSILTNILTNII